MGRHDYRLHCDEVDEAYQYLIQQGKYPRNWSLQKKILFYPLKFFWSTKVKPNNFFL